MAKAEVLWSCFHFSSCSQEAGDGPLITGGLCSLQPLP